MKMSIAGLSACLLSTQVLALQNDLNFEPVELRGGIVMLSTGAGGNLGVLTGDDGILLVDDLLPGAGPQVEAAIANLAGEGVPRFILNTHYHGDHTGSNDHFHAEGSTIVAHHNIRTRLANSDEFSAEGFLPVLTFGEDLHFHMNGETVMAVHVPSAHTDGDALVYFENANVLHMGDVLFNGLFPYIDLGGGGTVEGYLAALELAVEMSNADTQIIPGHGPVAGVADIQSSIAMIRETRDIVAALVSEGHSLEDILAAQPLADYHDDWSWGFICTDRMVTTLYLDASGETTSPLATRCN